MPKQYPAEFRQRVIALLEAGRKVADIAAGLDVITRSTVPTTGAEQHAAQEVLGFSPVLTSLPRTKG